MDGRRLVRRRDRGSSPARYVSSAAERARVRAYYETACSECGGPCWGRGVPGRRCKECVRLNAERQVSGGRISAATLGAARGAPLSVGLSVNETDRLLAALESQLEAARADRRRRDSLAYRQSLELLRAVRLAPSLEVCETILRNPRKVPISRLDPRWAKAYGLTA